MYYKLYIDYSISIFQHNTNIFFITFLHFYKEWPIIKEKRIIFRPTAVLNFIQTIMQLWAVKFLKIS